MPIQLPPLPANPVTRFAPSPTGYLHLGHAASAIFVWGIGRLVGAKVLLRIEDHDLSRVRPEYEHALFADLAWLGFVHDNQELRPKLPSEFRQSDASAAYREALAQLQAQNLIYACDCSRRQIAAKSLKSQAELRYSGRCRERGLDPEAKGLGLRLRLSGEAVTFHDGLLGMQTQVPATQCGDLLVRDRLRQYTYNFAVVVDDLRHGVNLVIRGQDLTHATGRQVLLARLMGASGLPSFLHHPLVKDEQGRKLSKRFFSTSIAERRSAGERAVDILGEAAYRSGLLSKPRPLAVSELPELFVR